MLTLLAAAGLLAFGRSLSFTVRGMPRSIYWLAGAAYWATDVPPSAGLIWLVRSTCFDWLKRFYALRNQIFLSSWHVAVDLFKS